MNRRSTWLLSAFAVVMALAPLTGCIFAADLINPAVIPVLGLDPNSINRPVGTVLVVFVNDTDQLAVFHGLRQDDPNDETTASTFDVQVDPDSNQNAVLSCPTGLVSLGFPASAGGGDDAAHVGMTQITFTGDPVLEGVDYLCGDLIEYRLSVIPGGDPASDFVITARIVPGR